MEIGRGGGRLAGRVGTAVRAAELAERLAADTEGVSRLLLGDMRHEGEYLVAGDVTGAAGKSLKIKALGPYRGHWRDFATDEHGDLLDLWRLSRDLDMAEAMRQVREHLGVERHDFERARQPARASLRIVEPVEARGKVELWLCDDRQIHPDALKAYRVGGDAEEAQFIAYTPEGHVQAVKYRSIREKKFRCEKGSLCCLFGWQSIPADAREVVITEGEIDALSWWPIPALSVTNGASSLGWIEHEFDRLDRFDTIYLAFDMDEAGRKALPRLVERLGRERCRIVELPRKDANECTQAHIELAPFLESARSLDPPELRRVADYRELALELINGGVIKEGVTVPWLYGFAFGRGELTVMAGPTGVGKSEMTNQITLHAMQQGERACIASLEFHPAKWLRNVTRQAGACWPITERYAEAILDWLDDRCLLYGKRGTIKAEKMIAVFAYAAKRYGCKWFVVDNLAKCGLSEDDYPAQKELADKLGDFANDYGAHVILVAHMRKDANGTLAGVKGSGGITDMADNVFSVWRNRDQEEKRELARIAGVDFFPDSFDASIKALKVRDGEREPGHGFMWHPDSHQFLPTNRKRIEAHEGPYDPIKFVSLEEPK